MNQQFTLNSAVHDREFAFGCINEAGKVTESGERIPYAHWRERLREAGECVCLTRMCLQGAGTVWRMYLYMWGSIHITDANVRSPRPSRKWTEGQLSWWTSEV